MTEPAAPGVAEFRLAQSEGGLAQAEGGQSLPAATVEARPGAGEPQPAGNRPSGSETSGTRQSGTEASGTEPARPSPGLTVTHRRYVPHSHAHYGGSLVDGAYVLGLFGDVATELSIRADRDEGLFASYSDVQFRAPVLAGDVLEVTAILTRVGRRSRGLAFEARVVCRAEPERGPSAARVLDEPVVVVTATGTVVAPLPAAG
jgi:3-aminobutyryl-CoA ammonia-lyase